MRGRFRNKSRPQAQEPLRFKQEHFEGALNEDSPASRIAPNELALLENIIAHEDGLEGRSGSQKYSDTALPGSGVVYGYFYHPSAKVHVLHRNTELYTAAAAMGSWTQVLPEHRGLLTQVNDTIVVAGGSQFEADTVTIWGMTASNSNAGTLYWGLTNSGSTRTLSIYKDSAGSDLVARGTKVGDGYINCAPQNNSGLSFTADVTYTGDDTTISANTITGAGLLVSSSGVEANNLKMIPYKEDLLIFENSGGILYVDISLNKLFRINSMYGLVWLPPPITDSGSQGSGTPYGRRYVYTFSRITDSAGTPDVTKNRISGTLMLESQANNVWNDSVFMAGADTNRDYGEHWFASAISAANAHTVDLTGGGDVDYTVTTPASYLGLYNETPLDRDANPAYTHLSLYGTLDIGDNGTDPVTGLGNNREIYVWIADIPVGTGTYSDVKSDAELRAGLAAGFGLRTRYWSALPTDNQVGDVIPGQFLFTADRDATKIHYCQLSKPEYIGYYQSAYQFFTTDDGVQDIQRVKDGFAVLCSRKTYYSAPQITQAVTGVESVFVIKSFYPTSESIGVIDYSSIARISESAFIAHCSDHTIRIFSGDRWGDKDLADRKVSAIIHTIHTGSVGAFFRGAYLLWYRNSSSQTTTTNACLRYGFGKDAGHGWSKMTGSGWIFPPLFTGAQLINDANSVQRLLALDNAGTAFYWVETFSGYTGSNLTKRYADKVAVAGTGGTAVACKLRFRELTGEEESHRVYHEETHIYFRPSGSSYESGFAVDLLAYLDGSSTATEEVTGVPRDGDMQFWKRIQGRRFQIEAEIATSGFKIVGVDIHYQSHDTATPGSGPVDTDEATYMQNLAGATTLKHWLTRPRNALNRATGTNYTASGTAVSNTTGPDGKSYGLLFSATSQYLQADTTSYTDFTVMFWARNLTFPSDAKVVVKLDGANDLTIQWDNGTSLIVESGEGFVTADVTGSTWRHYAIVRSGSTVTAYENATSLGTETLATARGGTQVIVGGGAETGAMEIYDLRIYNTALNAATITYYNDKVDTTEEGTKLLPIV